MCGVAGVIGPRPADCNVEAAAAALVDRGPDGSSSCASSGDVRRDGSGCGCGGGDGDGDALLLLASRLAHWDEGSPWQPFAEPDGSVAAFNGELFNLAQLQELLDRPGISEVEALLVGLRRLGPEFLRHVDGQFAVVARPVPGGPVIVARDRFGIAPMYWAPTPGGAVVASNLAALSALRGPLAIDTDGLAGVLADWAASGATTPWEGVHQVRPGHALVVDAGTVDDVRWAEAPAPNAAPATAVEPVAGAEVAEQWADVEIPDLDSLERALREAVGVRLRSTGTVACLISGGIDSTVIGAIAREEGAGLGLALCLEGDDLVGERQRHVADVLGMDLVQHMLTPAETVDCLERYVRTRHLPLLRLGPVGMTALARRARAEDIRGVLSGEGSDELFAGYDSYRILAARAGAFGPPARLPWAEFGTPEIGGDRGPVFAKSYWRALIAFSADAGARRVDILRPVAELLRSPLREVVTGEAPVPDTADPTSPRLEDPLEARRQIDLERLLAGYLLTVQGDHAWMEEGVELRPPYLASPVADWALHRSVRDFVSIEQGKRPVRALLPRLAQRNPALADLGFAKAAFRVDVSFVMRDPEQFERLAVWAGSCPDTVVDHAAVSSRIDAIRQSGTCSESESQLLIFAASMGLLAS